MFTLTPQSLPEEEQRAWSTHNSQIHRELKEAHPGIRECVAQSVSWFEFLRGRWGFSCRPPVCGSNPLEYAQKVDDHGPDLRALRHRVGGAMRKSHSKPHKRGARDSSQPVPKFNNAYTYFVRRRFRELADSGETIRVSDAVPMIAKEWAALTPEERELARREWEDYAQNFNPN